MKAIEEFLDLHTLQSGLGKIFWIPLPAHLLTQMQTAHSGCQPHMFAAELGTHWIKIEFFVRSLRGLRCDCQAYSTSSQEQFILHWARQMIEELCIKT